MDHLRHRKEQGVEADLHNYAGDAVILSTYGVFEGHVGVQESARILREHLPYGAYHYDTTLTSGEMAFLGWHGESDVSRIEDGADSFLIRDGLIRVQTIHYRVEKNG